MGVKTLKYVFLVLSEGALSGTPDQSRILVELYC